MLRDRRAGSASSSWLAPRRRGSSARSGRRPHPAGADRWGGRWRRRRRRARPAARRSGPGWGCRCAGPRRPRVSVRSARVPARGPTASVTVQASTSSKPGGAVEARGATPSSANVSSIEPLVAATRGRTRAQRSSRSTAEAAAARAAASTRNQRSWPSCGETPVRPTAATTRPSSIGDPEAAGARARADEPAARPAPTRRSPRSSRRGRTRRAYSRACRATTSPTSPGRSARRTVSAYGRLVVVLAVGDLALELRHDVRVAQRRDVAELAALGDVAQQAAHDLARARLGKVVGPDDALGPRELADPLRDVLADLGDESSLPSRSPSSVTKRRPTGRCPRRSARSPRPRRPSGARRPRTRSRPSTCGGRDVDHVVDAADHPEVVVVVLRAASPTKYVSRPERSKYVAT